MEKHEFISGFILELRRGTLILCVLAKLRAPTYGYSLIPALAESGITIEANTLYPLLRRLESQKLLASEWSTEGPKPRKYYRTTDFGEEVLAELVRHWQSTVNSVEAVVKESNHGT